MITIATKFAPYPEYFQIAQQAGFCRAELWTDVAVLAAWQQVASRAIEYPLEYAIHFPNQLEQSDETLQQAVELYRALDCHALIVHQPHQDRYGERLRQLAPDMRLAVENHKLDRQAFIDWAERNPGLTLDVEHVWQFTLSDCPLAELLEFLESFLRRYADKLHHVHMPGYLPGQPQHRPMYCSRDLTLNVLTLLDQIGFEGLIVSEVNPEFQNLHDLRMDLLLYERWRVLRAGGNLASPNTTTAGIAPLQATIPASAL